MCGELENLEHELRKAELRVSALKNRMHEIKALMKKDK
jgi:hypothetical protein